MPAFTALVRPYRDRPDIVRPWLFYPAPADAVDGPYSFICPRWWDERERWESLGVGIVWGSQKRYTGPVPNRAVGPLVGTPDEWANGLLWSVHQAGGYADPVGCWPLAQTGRVRDVETLIGRVISAYAFTGQVNQVETAVGNVYQPFHASGRIDQVETAVGNVYQPFHASGRIDQVETAVGTSAATIGAAGRLAERSGLVGTSSATLGAAGRLAERSGLVGTSSATLGAAGRLAERSGLVGTSSATLGAAGRLAELSGLVGRSSFSLPIVGQLAEIERVSGTANYIPNPPNPCANCLVPPPAKWSVTVSMGGGGFCDGFTGTWILSQLGSLCVWVADQYPSTGRYRYTLQRGGGSNWVLSSNLPDATIVTQWGSGYMPDCSIPATLGAVFAPFCVPPQNVTIVPYP